MKALLKLLKTRAALFAALLCVSAAFAQGVESDDYQDAPKTTAQSKTASSAKKKKQKQKEFGSSGNVFKDFIFGKQKYIFYDSIDLSKGTAAFGIKTGKAEMIYNPKTQKAGLQVRYQTSYFNLLLDEKERAQIINAVSMYIDDFDNKRLVRKHNSKTRKIYGQGKCYEEWGTVKAMMNYYTNTKIQYGYEFKKDSPYFCLIIKGAKNEQKNMGSNVPEKSVEVQLYFTKSKAKVLAQMLSAETIAEQHKVYTDFMASEAVAAAALQDEEAYTEDSSEEEYVE